MNTGICESKFTSVQFFSVKKFLIVVNYTSHNLPSPSIVLCLVTQSRPAFCDSMDCSPPGSSVHGNCPDKNTGVGCRALLQGIVPTQGLNPGLLHCRRILYRLSHLSGLQSPQPFHLAVDFPDSSQSSLTPTPSLPNCPLPISHYSQGPEPRSRWFQGRFPATTLAGSWAQPGCGASGLARWPGLLGDFHNAVLLAPAELSSLPLGRQLNKFRQLSASPSTCGLRLPRVKVTRGGWSQGW